MVKQGVLDDEWWAIYDANGKFWKTLVRLEKSTLLAVLWRFCMGLLWRGFDKKMQIFGPWSGILAGSSARRCNFVQSHKLLIIDYALIWQLASGRVRCYTIFQVSNRSSRCILDRSGGCWEDFLWGVTRATPGCTAFFPWNVCSHPM
jgi:hypothetical protein